MRVTRRGRLKGRFGWEICVVERSTKTFPTRAQALIASAKAASLLAFPLTVDPLNLRHQAREAGNGQKAILKRAPKARARSR